MTAAGPAPGGSASTPLSFVTVATTAVAAGASLLFTAWAWHRYRHAGGGSDKDVAESESALAFTGALLGAVFCVSILFVGLPDPLRGAARDLPPAVLTVMLGHGGRLLGPHALWGAWSLDPLLFGGLAVVGWAYARGGAGRRRGEPTCGDLGALWRGW